ncbi:MAG TPA: hypothetical protein PLP17_09225 [Oligoflexia bacterium]|nr:hypothetical protein [Oligoflexia bacterium]
MDDSFFKLFFICTFVLIFLAGAIMFFQMEAQSADSRAIKAYVESRGRAPIPPSWRNKIGAGIGGGEY